MKITEFKTKIAERMGHCDSPSCKRVMAAIQKLFAAVQLEGKTLPEVQRPHVAAIAAEHLYRMGEALASEMR